MQRVCSIAVAVAFTCGTAGNAQAQLRTRVHASGFALPLGFVQDPMDRTVRFVVQQGGRIRVVRNGTVQPADFLDLTRAVVAGGEQGLLGLAFAPDYAVSGRFYVNFTNTAGQTTFTNQPPSASQRFYRAKEL